MPTYDYKCKDCNKIFEVDISYQRMMTDHGQRCTHCGSTNTIKTWTSVPGIVAGCLDRRNLAK